MILADAYDDLAKRGGPLARTYEAARDRERQQAIDLAVEFSEYDMQWTSENRVVYDPKEESPGATIGRVSRMGRQAFEDDKDPDFVAGTAGHETQHSRRNARNQVATGESWPRGAIHYPLLEVEAYRWEIRSPHYQNYNADRKSTRTTTMTITGINLKRDFRSTTTTCFTTASAKKRSTVQTEYQSKILVTVILLGTLAATSAACDSTESAPQSYPQSYIDRCLFGQLTAPLRLTFSCEPTADTAYCRATVENHSRSEIETWPIVDVQVTVLRGEKPAGVSSHPIVPLALHTLPPGQQLEHKFFLSQYYETAPGDYMVTAFYTMPESLDWDSSACDCVSRELNMGTKHCLCATDVVRVR